MVSSGVWGRILRRIGGHLMAKPSLFPSLRRIFRGLGGFCERGKAVLIPVRHCVRQALFPLCRSYGLMFARVLTADKGSAGDLALLGRCL